MPDTVLKVKKISHSFTRKKERQTILDGISFEAKPQEVIGIMGPSGCGKTTLLKILGGILHAEEGELTLFNEDCTHEMPKHIKRRVGYIFQDSNLLPWRSVEDNLRLPLEMFKERNKGRNEELISNALEIVGLSEYRQLLPQELSGGMAQRVGIARAMVLEADVLLMDQPFGALDALTRQKLRFDFLNILETSRNTTVIVTNSIDEALLLSNRILLLSSLPARISQVIEVTVPFENRKQEVAYDPQFTELRKRMIELVSAQYANLDDFVLEEDCDE